MSPEKSARSSRRYQHVLQPPRVFIGLQADRDVFSALMPAWYVRSHHLHPSHPAGEASFNWRSKRGFPPAGRILVDKRRLLLDWLPRSRSSAACYTRRCAFCFGRASMRPLVQTCGAPPVHHMLHAVHPHARSHARTAAHSIALLARGRSLLLPSHLAGHFSARCWCQSVMPAAFDTYGSDCARWCCSIFSDRAQCSPFLSRRVLGAVA